MPTNDPFPDVLDMRQVAAKLGKSHSWLKGYLRSHPCGRMVGAKRVFTPSDYAALLASFPKDQDDPRHNAVRGRQQLYSPSIGRASGRSAYEELLARHPEPKKGKPRPKSV